MTEKENTDKRKIIPGTEKYNVIVQSLAVIGVLTPKEAAEKLKQSEEAKKKNS